MNTKNYIQQMFDDYGCNRMKKKDYFFQKYIALPEIECILQLQKDVVKNK